jgi:hypothetical protein
MIRRSIRRVPALSLAWLALAWLALAAPAAAGDQTPLTQAPNGPGGAPVVQQMQAGDTVGVPHGGTGAATLAAHAVVLGEGASAVHLAPPNTAGDVFVDNGASSDPSFQAFSLSLLPSLGANTVLANFTSASAPPNPNTVPNCSSSSHALNYTSGSGFGCTNLTSSGGGGGIDEASCGKPIAASFTQLNFAASTSATDGIGALILGNTAAAGQISAMIVTPTSAPYKYYMRVFGFSIGNGGNGQFGFILRNSTNGRIVIAGPYGAAGLDALAQNWTNYTTYNSSIVAGPLPMQMQWWELSVDASGNIKIYVSPNGWDWSLTPFASTTIAAFLTASGGGALDQIGFFVYGASAPNMVWVSCFQTTAPS